MLFYLKTKLEKRLLMEFLKKIAGLFLTKKKIIGWVSAVLIAIAAVFFGIDQKEIKQAIQDGPEITLPAVTPAIDGK